MKFVRLNLHFFALLCEFFAFFAVNEHLNRKEREGDAKIRKGRLQEHLKDTLP